MVRQSMYLLKLPMELSVLALSSRFDGPLPLANSLDAGRLSVLALSSRFDGQVFPGIPGLKLSVFQYSLCRVVLMV